MNSRKRLAGSLKKMVNDFHHQVVFVFGKVFFAFAFYQHLHVIRKLHLDFIINRESHCQTIESWTQIRA